MIARLIDRAATMAQLVAAGLVALSTTKFAVAGFQFALRATDPTAELPEAETSRREVRVHRTKQPRKDRTQSEAEAPTGRPVRLTLAVTVGPPRSEVFVNGRRVGHSPFFGDVSCKEGLELRVEVVPVEEPLMTFVKRCRSGTLTLSHPPL